jgi:hypothetical protein
MKSNSSTYILFQIVAMDTLQIDDSLTQHMQKIHRKPGAKSKAELLKLMGIDDVGDSFNSESKEKISTKVYRNIYQNNFYLHVNIMRCRLIILLRVLMKMKPCL